jgi:putative ABC transport system ATP-binding protein
MAIATPARDAAAVQSTVLAASELTRQYGEADAAVHALRGVSIGIPEGQFAAVMGPSGSGKSTLMHILAGLDSPTSGQVWVGGEEITNMDDDELTLLRRRSIGFIFQFFNLLPMLTAQQNVVLPLSIAGEDVDAEWVEEVMDKVGLGDRRSHRPSELSGGQQQRVAIARALVSRPTILFADEPTGNLDSTMSEEILHALRDSVDSYGQTTMMVTHEASAAAVADRIVFLADGETVEDEYGLDEHAVLGTMERLAHR